jgi:hypothetical protein
MDVMTFLADKPAEYQEKFLEAVSAHRSGETGEEATAIDVLMSFHSASDIEPDSMRRLLNHLVEMAATMSDIDEKAMESYANFGPRPHTT